MLFYLKVVEWIVVDNPVIEISDDQLLEFQSILDPNGKYVTDFFKY
jgi:hypothetical protein